MGLGDKPKKYDQIIQKAKEGALESVIEEKVIKVQQKSFKAKCTISNNPALPTSIDKEYWKNLSSKYQETKIDTKIEIEDIPFDEGQTSYVFRINDLTRKKTLVGKIEKSIWHKKETDDLGSAQ